MIMFRSLDCFAQTSIFIHPGKMPKSATARSYGERVLFVLKPQMIFPSVATVSYSLQQCVRGARCPAVSPAFGRVFCLRCPSARAVVSLCGLDLHFPGALMPHHEFLCSGSAFPSLWSGSATPSASPAPETPASTTS